MTSVESESALKHSMATNDDCVNSTPIETSIETPIETPIETQIETPIETSIETPIGTPIQTPIIHNISPRTISGVLTQSNQKAIDWSSNGLIAFGCHNKVIIANTKASIKCCQSLHRHHTSVCLIKWCNTTALKLSSADINGTIIIWDVSEASVLALIPGTKDTKSIESMDWIELQNNVENSGQNYLLVLYRNNNLILYDTEFGEMVWNKHFDMNIKSISLDPFCMHNILFGIQSNECSFAFVDDLRANRCPNGLLKEYKINIKGSYLTPNSPKNTVSHLKYNLVVKSVANEAEDSNDLNILNEYIQISFHRSVRNQLFVVFNREILLIDLSIEAIICCVPLERNCSNIKTVFSCLNRNAFFVCHDFGTISLRLFQKQLIPNPEEGTSLFNLSYINLCQSDGLRLTKQNKIFGYCISPLDETKIALLLNNGRIIVKTVHKSGTNSCNEELSVPYISDLIPIEEYEMSEVKKAKTYRILMTQLFQALNYSPNVVRMCPAVTLRNWPIHKPLLAIGDSSGTIQIWNLSLSMLDREFSIHSFPVRGIEWTSLSTFISFAFPNISPNSGKTNNELNLTEVTSGRTYSLRTEKNADSSPIELLRISHLKQYLIILFKEDPFEIWDLKTLTLLRVMPKQFAAITAIEWSPLYNKRIDNINDKLSVDESNSTAHHLPSKENFVVTNTNGELYHFSIEGNIVKEITCIPPDTEMSANITCIAWKSDQVLLGDASGHLNVWDLKKKVSRSQPTHRGSVKKIRFGPGRGNMKFLILYNDGVDIWDIKDFKLNAQLKSPRDISCKICDIDWAGSDRPILATTEGMILITDMKLKHYTSAISDLVFNEVDYENINFHSVNFHLLPQMSQFIFKTKLVCNQLDVGSKLPDCDVKRIILVSKLFNDSDSYHFWNIFSYLISDNKQKLDLNNDLFMNNECFKEILREKLSLLESIRNTYNQNKICYQLNLLLNEPHRAVQLLLETEPHAINDYYVDALRACLIASLQSKSADSTAHPVVKLVATNLIANGKIDEGSQLLCLIGKTQDACRYLQSANKWLEAVWLAKCTLNVDEYNEIMRRWSEHLILETNVKTAILVFLSIKQFSKVIQLMYKYDIEKAVLFASVCIKKGLINIEDNKVILEQIFENYSKILENSGLDQAIDYYKHLLKNKD